MGVVCVQCSILVYVLLLEGNSRRVYYTRLYGGDHDNSATRRGQTYTIHGQAPYRVRP